MSLGPKSLKVIVLKDRRAGIRSFSFISIGISDCCTIWIKPSRSEKKGKEKVLFVIKRYHT